MCVGGRLRDFPTAEVQCSWKRHFIKPSYSLFAVVDEDEQHFLAPGKLDVHIADVGVQWPNGTRGIELPQCGGGQAGFNHRWMHKLYLRLPLCLRLIEKHERRQQRRFEFASFVRPDVIWNLTVPHLALLYDFHRHGRELLVWDDHMAVMPRSYAAAYFLGAAHAVLHCGSVDDWMEACGLDRVEAYRKEWYAPGVYTARRRPGYNLSSAIYRDEVSRFVKKREAPCSPLRLISSWERVSICDCGLIFAMGGRCLALEHLKLNPRAGVFVTHARLANDRTHKWFGVRPFDQADPCSGSFNLDSIQLRNIWLNPRPEARASAREV